MSRQQLDRFRERAGRVQLPESVREAVLSETASVRGRQNVAQGVTCPRDGPS